MLAAYASHPDASRGRLRAEPESPTRSVFQRDRDRIIHCGAFRRLQYKTQVFVHHEGDHYRTRLTHTLEVAQITRSMARTLGAEETLAEAIALAHDLGHTPFGHAGEAALNAVMLEAAPACGGFHHNDQTIRVLTVLEQRYAEFDGLNLTWETLEGVAKHNGPLLPAAALPPAIAEADRHRDLALDSQASLEAQIAAIADDIAYVNHDIDDGLRAGLFDVRDLAALDLTGPIVAGVDDRYPGLEPRRRVHEAVRRVINRMIADAVAETGRRLEMLGIGSPAAVRAAPMAMVAFSDDLAPAIAEVRDFLFRRMYRHYRVNRETSKARRIVTDLFRLLVAEPNCLPDAWHAPVRNAGMAERARIVGDYIAGMTDRYAQIEHQRLFDLTPRM